MTFSDRVSILARCAVLVVAFAAPRPAHADGAFPDEFSIHFPRSAPDRIIVGANFGLMVSEDRGSTWRYACEPYVTEDSSNPLAMVNVVYYQAGAADGEVFQVATNYKMRRTVDDGCSWTTSGGALASLQAIDMFPNPTDPQFVLAIGLDPLGQGSSLLASHDGAITFEAPPQSNTTKNLFAGVEMSGTTVYLTEASGTAATLWRSDDSAATWHTYPLPKLPDGSASGVVPLPRIVAIDPEDPSIVYLRLIGPPYDAIAIASGGGQSVQIAQVVTGTAFSAFARGTDRTLYAGTADGKLYVRPAGASAFNAPVSGPHFRCLGQRFGNTTDLYACANMFQDGFSIGVSHDHGQTFQRVMRLPEMLGPLTCPSVQTACAAHWARIQSVFATDGGTADGGGGQQPGGGGGGCASGGAGAFAAVAVIAALLRRRARGTA